MTRIKRITKQTDLFCERSESIENMGIKELMIGAIAKEVKLIAYQVNAIVFTIYI